ncbi:MAG: hypothetical protein ACOY46_13060 [Bacillota bacterium]
MKKWFVLVLLLVLVMIPGLALAEADLIPTMTSNTNPDGVVSASSTFSSDNEAYMAFDDIISAEKSWIGAPVSWLEYEFSVSKIVNAYSIQPYHYGGVLAYLPGEWTFEGWNGSNWITLDQRQNVSSWVIGEKKVFSFSNDNAYKKYRLNITNLCPSTYNNYVGIYEMEMFGNTPTPTDQIDLTATAGNAQVVLNWDAVANATGYNVKRATTSGGPYTTIATNVSGTTYTDASVTNGTTYYYVVTAIVNGVESGNSNEAPATPQGTVQPPSGNKALLVITMNNQNEKEYDLTMTEINSFVNWYNGCAGGSGNQCYVISKNYNMGPFTSRKEYLAYNKISSFEVMEY